MKRLCLILSLTFGTLFLQTNTIYASNFLAESVNQGNIDMVLQDIRAYYASTFIPGEVANIDDAMDSISYLMTRLLEYPVSSTCTPGTISGMRPIPSGNETILNVTWKNGNSQTYFGAAIDLVNLDRRLDIKNQPEVRVSVSNYIDKKFFAFNGICANGQSSYYIIIIEKDLDFKSLTGGKQGGEGINPTASNRTALLTHDNLSVFPNPMISNTSATLEFSIPKLQKASIRLIEASSGKLASVLIADRLFSPGNYRESVSLSGLPAGIYFLVLKTKEDQVMQKFVIVSN